MLLKVVKKKMSSQLKCHNLDKVTVLFHYRIYIQRAHGWGISVSDF